MQQNVKRIVVFTVYINKNKFSLSRPAYKMYAVWIDLHFNLLRIHRGSKKNVLFTVYCVWHERSACSKHQKENEWLKNDLYGISQSYEVFIQTFIVGYVYSRFQRRYSNIVRARYDVYIFYIMWIHKNIMVHYETEQLHKNIKFALFWLSWCTFIFYWIKQHFFK